VKESERKRAQRAQGGTEDGGPNAETPPPLPVWTAKILDLSVYTSYRKRYVRFSLQSP